MQGGAGLLSRGSPSASADLWEQRALMFKGASPLRPCFKGMTSATMGLHHGTLTPPLPCLPQASVNLMLGALEETSLILHCQESKTW